MTTTTTRSGPEGDDRHEIAASAALWARLRREAEQAVAQDPVLAPLLVATILDRVSLEEAVGHRIARRLGCETLPEFLVEDLYRQAVAEDRALGAAFRADIAAVHARDPACTRLLEPLLYFKGFHAIATHRLAHWLWTRSRPDLALYLQSRASELFQVDINPAARFGKGIFLDHATGLVVGATAVVDDDVTISQDVTLGGTGKEIGDRHPKVKRGVSIGAGAKILGNIEIGAGARIAVGSVVLHPVPPGTIVAGVPARIVEPAGAEEPLAIMPRIMSRHGYDSFAYTI